MTSCFQKEAQSDLLTNNIHTITLKVVRALKRRLKQTTL